MSCLLLFLYYYYSFFCNIYRWCQSESRLRVKQSSAKYKHIYLTVLITLQIISVTIQ